MYDILKNENINLFERYTEIAEKFCLFSFIRTLMSYALGYYAESALLFFTSAVKVDNLNSLNAQMSSSKHISKYLTGHL